MAYQPVNTTDTPNQGRIKWNANDTELYQAKSGVVSLGAFGALPTGNSTDAAANNAAITSAIAALPTYGGTIIVPAASAEYCISAEVNITKAITFLGEGMAPFQGGLLGGGVWRPLSTFKWTGASGASVFKVNGPFSGAGFHNLMVDCNHLAARAFRMDRWQYGRISNVAAQFFTSEAMHLLDAGTQNDQNCRHNEVSQFLAMGGPTMFRLSGTQTVPGRNTCHNSFYRCDGHLDGTAHGVIFEDADNNSFYNCVMFGPDPATNGFHGWEFQAYGRANYLYHVQNSVIARTPYNVGADASANTIFGYDRENNQSAPVVETGARLDWTESGSHSTGWHVERITHGGNRTNQKPTPTVGGSPGSGYSIAVDGNDSAGLITFTTGTAGAGWTNILLSYYRTYPVKPRVFFEPANDNAALLAGASRIYYNEAESFASQAQFWPAAVAGTLDNSKTYKWHYYVTL